MFCIFRNTMRKNFINEEIKFYQTKFLFINQGGSMDNIVAKVIRNTAVKKSIDVFAYMLGVSLVMFLDQDIFLTISNKCKPVNSVYEINQAFENGNNHVKFTALEILESGIMEEGDTAAIYLCALFEDGALFFKTPKHQYRKGRFDGENIQLKGIIRKPKENENVREMFLTGAAELIGVQVTEINDELIATSIFEEAPYPLVYLVSATFIVGGLFILKYALNFVFYKKTKSYRSLEYLYYESLDDAEEEVNYDYGEEQDEHIFENKSIFISKNFIIMKYPAAFRNTEDLNDIDCFMKRTKYGSTHYIEAYFDDEIKPVRFQARSEYEMNQIINVLRTNVLYANASVANANNNNFNNYNSQ